MEAGTEKMKIGEVVKRTGLAASRIRYYEELGLLPDVTRLPNGYRVYSMMSVQVLQMIVIGQNAGFSLGEIRELAPDDDSKWDHNLISDTLERKISEIKKEEARLAGNRLLLESIKSALSDRPDGINCDENKQRMINFVLPKDQN